MHLIKLQVHPATLNASFCRLIGMCELRFTCVFKFKRFSCDEVLEDPRRRGQKSRTLQAFGTLHLIMT